MENSTETMTTALPGNDFGGLIPLVTAPRWAFNVELVLMIIVFMFGVPGNTIIILVQSKTANKTSTDYLVMAMAMYELLSSSLNATMRILRDIDAVWAVAASVFACKLTPLGYYFAQPAASQTLGALAVDRCIKTMFPLSTWYGVRQANAVNVLIFLVSVTLSIPQVFTYHWDPNLSMECALTAIDSQVSKAFGIAGSMIQLMVFIALSVSYFLIAVTLKRRHMRKVARRKNQLTSIESGVKTIAADDRTTMNTDTVANDKSTNDVTNDVTSEGEKTSDGQLQNLPKTKTKMLTLEGRNVNKLTGLMFLISLFYVATNLILWYLFVSNPFTFGAGVLQLAFAIPMLNCISNPIMFFTMSSRFRNNVKLLVFNK